MRTGAPRTRGMTARAAVRVVIAALIFGAAILVLHPFLPALMWSAVIVGALWPCNRAARRVLPRGLAAAGMTTALTLILFGAFVPITFEISRELKQLAVEWPQRLAAVQSGWASLAAKIPQSLSSIATIEDMATAEGLSTLFKGQERHIAAFAAFLAKGVAEAIFTLAVIIFSSFFLFRDGDRFAARLVTLGRFYGGTSVQRLSATAFSAALSVVYGVLCTAFAQGVLAGVGFYAAGVPSPALLGFATMLFSLLPFGTPLVYLPAGVWLLMSDAPWYYGVGLLAWGIGVVSTVDNIIRPFFISQGTNLSFMLALFGIIGGIAAFGVAGIVVGPVILAAASAVVFRERRPLRRKELGRRSPGAQDARAD